MDCDGQPDQGLGDAAELVGAIQGLGDTLGTQTLRQLCLEGGEVGLDVLARNLTGICLLYTSDAADDAVIV